MLYSSILFIFEAYIKLTNHPFPNQASAYAVFVMKNKKEKWHKRMITPTKGLPVILITHPKIFQS
jgi:hypothetical protein